MNPLTCSTCRLLVWRDIRDKQLQDVLVVLSPLALLRAVRPAERPVDQSSLDRMDTQPWLDQLISAGVQPTLSCTLCVHCCHSRVWTHHVI